MSDSEPLKPEKRASGAKLALLAWAFRLLGHLSYLTQGAGIQGAVG